jgi:anti-anti-sigma factor
VSQLITPDASGPVPIARVAGDVDLASAAEMREKLLAMAADNINGLVVDLTEVAYLDSSGVKVLFHVARDLGRRDQTLLVTVPIGSPLRRVLKIAGLHEVAPICDDIEAAFKLIAQQRTQA